MQGATFDEFKSMIISSWEIDFTCGEHTYHYERSAATSGFEVYLLEDGEYVYQKTTADMSKVLDDVLAFKLRDGRSLEEAQEDIVVLAEA